LSGRLCAPTNSFFFAQLVPRSIVHNRPDAPMMRNRKSAFVVKELTADEGAADSSDHSLTAAESTDSTSSPSANSSDAALASAAFLAAADVSSAAAPIAIGASAAAAAAAAARSSVSSAARSAASDAEVARRRAARNDSTPEFALLFLFVLMACGALAMFLLSSPLGLVGSRSRKMQDTSFRLVVSLEAVQSGATVQSAYPGGRQIVCPHCGGSGGDGPGGVSQCTLCEGAGHKRMRRQVAPGFWQTFQQTYVGLDTHAQAKTV
jgi:hypothetical protein